MKTPEIIATQWLASSMDRDTDSTMFDEVCVQPELAWEAILKIVSNELTDHQLALLAAGPVEELLCAHGERFIDRIEVEAKRNAKFNHLLGGVWQRTIPEAIWRRIENARNESW